MIAQKNRKFVGVGYWLTVRSFTKRRSKCPFCVCASLEIAQWILNMWVHAISPTLHRQSGWLMTALNLITTFKSSNSRQTYLYTTQSFYQVNRSKFLTIDNKNTQIHTILKRTCWENKFWYFKANISTERCNFKTDLSLD